MISETNPENFGIFTFLLLPPLIVFFSSFNPQSSSYLCDTFALSLPPSFLAPQRQYSFRGFSVENSTLTHNNRVKKASRRVFRVSLIIFHKFKWECRSCTVEWTEKARVGEKWGLRIVREFFWVKMQLK